MNKHPKKKKGLDIFLIGPFHFFCLEINGRKLRETFEGQKITENETNESSRILFLKEPRATGCQTVTSICKSRSINTLK